MSIVKSTAVAKLFLLLLSVLFTLSFACNQAQNPQTPSARSDITYITILHTNDAEGRLDNMPRLSTGITQIREDHRADNILLLDAGDIFSGSIYGTTYQGQASLWFMNYLGYDAVCLGNHEFDEGAEVLANFVGGANFHIVSANLEFPHNNILNNLITPWVIIEREGERYGIFGLLTEDTPEISNAGKDIAVDNYVAAAREAVAELERLGINKIIALNHIGWDKDMKLARNVGGIDIIIGGHTHTVPEVYPSVVDEDGSPTLIAQAGEHAEYLGRLNVLFDDAGVVIDWTGSEILQLDDTITEDFICTAKLAELKAPITELITTIIGSTLVDLDGDRNKVRGQETNLGNLVADSMLYKASCIDASIAIVNGGGIRASIPKADITLEQVMAMLPFDNYLVTFELTGEQILMALENGVSQVEEVQGRFPQVAGLRFTWDPEAKPGSRIISVEVKKPDRYEPLNSSATYRVVTNNFLYQGGDGYTIFAEGTDFINLGYTDYEVLAEYITANSPIDIQIEGRISRK